MSSFAVSIYFLPVKQIVSSGETNSFMPRNQEFHAGEPKVSAGGTKSFKWENQKFLALNLLLSRHETNSFSPRYKVLLYANPKEDKAKAVSDSLIHELFAQFHFKTSSVFTDKTEYRLFFI